jgi:hypothetical protein
MSAREQDWQTVVVGDVLEFSSPVALDRTTAEGTDTTFSEWQGSGLTVRVDYGLFVDPLKSSQRQGGAEVAVETIDGLTATRVSYTQADGMRFTAVHFPDLSAVGGGRNKLTMVVLSPSSRAAEDARRMLTSVKFRR